jgi:thiamine biosynthesis lipoprotein
LLLIITLLFFGACIPPSRQSESRYALGTICTINLYDKGRPRVYSGAFARINELEDILSASRDGTDLDKVNKNAGIGPVKVRPELIDVLKLALYYAEESRGAFDPSVGPLVRLWGIGTEKERIPEEEEISQALDLINYRDIEINDTEETVFLKRAGMALDLGAIAKGYAIDDTAAFLAKSGIDSGIIDFGGDIFALGEKKGKKKGERKDREENYWRIGIQDPKGNRGTYIGVLRVKNKSVVTSGNYERYFEEAGRRYHHIFSVKNGYPAENGLLSVTIAAGDAADADALSTAAFALGWEGGRDLIARADGAEGIFVFDDLSVRLTEDLEKDFTLTADEYYIVR